MFARRMIAIVLSGSLLVFTAPAGFAQQSDEPPEQAPTPVVKQTPQQLQQLVAPIALYPDELVAEVLAAATYPTEVVEADRWLQDHKDLQGKALGDEVDQQPWDSSVKALTEFPSVLANMDKNLSWTSSLGDAYINQQPDVMDAVQVMRKRAQDAGNLQSNTQQQIKTNNNTIAIEPANPEVVYVPTYDPWLVYGEPVGIWPGWYWYPGLYVDGPGLYFGLGFGLGFFGGYGWGWNRWGFDWGRRSLLYNHGAYFSHSSTFAHRGDFYHGRGDFGGRGGFSGSRGPSDSRGFSSSRGPSDSRGFSGSRASEPSRGAQGGTRSGAFSGFDHGGVARGYSSAGRSSFGGSRGGFSGGGGFHGGGGRR